MQIAAASGGDWIAQGSDQDPCQRICAGGTVAGEASPAECEFALSAGPLATAELSADSWSWDSPRVLQSGEAGAVDPSLPDSVFMPPPG